MSTTIYGIKNCETMKKACADAAKLRAWCKAVGWKALVNTQGTTWRKLSPEEQAIGDESGAIALMQAKPSVIRRPVVEGPDGALLVGYDPARFAVAFGAGNL